MRIINIWNKISDLLLEVLKIITFLSLFVLVIVMVINIIKGIDDNIYRYGFAVIVFGYINNKLNGG